MAEAVIRIKDIPGNQIQVNLDFEPNGVKDSSYAHQLAAELVSGLSQTLPRGKSDESDPQN